jgi:hypothetical protein
MQSRAETIQKGAAKASMGLTAGGLGYAAIASSTHGLIAWELMVAAGVVGVAALATGARRLLPNMFARGAAWAVAAPAALTLAFMGADGQFSGLVAAIAGTSALSLALSRRSLASAEARAAFAPVVSRDWLLAASSTSLACGAIAGFIALEQLRWGHVGVGPLLFALAFVASAVGVLRMRGWGLLLGGVTAIAAVTLAAIAGGAASLLFALMAVPGLMMIAPILRAKLGPGERTPDAPATTRVSDEVVQAATVAPSRARIALDTLAEPDESGAREASSARASMVA